MIEQSNELVRAVAAVMGGVHRLGKDDDNKFANYKFTSVDDFKDHLRPLLAANGLAIRMSETGFDHFEALDKKGGKALLCRFTFAISLAHESGFEEPPETTTVMLPYAQAQTTGQARSYALKEWLKSKFLASSGDISEDADSHEQREFRTTLPKKDARAVYTKLEKEIRALERDVTTTKQRAMDWAAANKGEIDILPEDWQGAVRHLFATLLHTIKTRQPLGNGGDKPQFADPMHAAGFDAQAPSTLREQLDESLAATEKYAARIADWEERLSLAEPSAQAEIWETEIAPFDEEGKLFPPDRDRLQRLIVDAA